MSAPAAPTPGQPVSLLRRLLVNTSMYTIGNLLVMAGSVVSFPILTRLLTVEEYGLMGLVTSTLLFLVAIAKVGVQSSSIRFYSGVAAGTLPYTEQQFFSTVLFGMAGLGAGASVAWLGLSQLTPVSWWNDERVLPLFLLTAVVILIRVVDSALTNLLRAQQRAVAGSVVNVIKRYLTIGFTVGSIVLISRSVFGFYYGLIAAEALMVLGLAVYVHRSARFSPGAFSSPLFRKMLAFGIPLVGSELGSVLLIMGDRYLLQNMLGAEDVGKYTAAYNLCEYAEIIVIASIGTAIIPIYLKLYDEKGRAATEAFLDKSLRYYLLVGLPLIAGLSAVGEEAIVVLASAKYGEGAVVIPWVISGTFLSGLQTIAIAGLYVANRTRWVMGLVLAAAVLNVGLNLVLIPRMGIEGAAVATLVSYLALTIAERVLSNSILSVHMPWLTMVKFGAAAGVMYLAITRIELGTPVVTLGVRVVSGALIYAAIVVAIDGETRDVAMRVVRRLVRR